MGLDLECPIMSYAPRISFPVRAFGQNQDVCSCHEGLPQSRQALSCRSSHGRVILRAPESSSNTCGRIRGVFKSLQPSQECLVMTPIPEGADRLFLLL